MDEWTVIAWDHEAGCGRMPRDDGCDWAVFGAYVSPKELNERLGNPFEVGDP